MDYTMKDKSNECYKNAFIFLAGMLAYGLFDYILSKIDIINLLGGV